MSAVRRDTLIALPLLTHQGRRSTRATEIVTGVEGRPLAELSLAPDLLVAQTLLEQKRIPPLAAEDRVQRLIEAADRFLDDEIGGLTFAEHNDLVSRASGHGPLVTETAGRAVATAIADAPTRADRGRPVGSVTAWQEAVSKGGSGVWTRRGETLAAVLSGNSPTIQNGWLQALALGYRVSVRPSRREPFTAFRAIEALRASGFRDTDVAYVPTTHGGVSALLRHADLGFVYGGDDIVSKYGSSPTIKVAGPGRTKTLLTGGDISDTSVESVAHAVAALSGAGCVNTTAVYAEGDHDLFARRLASVLTSKAEDQRRTGDHLGPRVTDETAVTLRRYLQDRARSARAVIPLESVFVPHDGGGTVLDPAVFVVDDPFHDALSTELPFPCVWVAPWTPADGTGPLRDSLIVNAVSTESTLIEQLLFDPSIRNVYVGAATVHSDGDLPHEGYVGDFLMRNKAVVGE